MPCARKAEALAAQSRHMQCTVPACEALLRNNLGPRLQRSSCIARLIEAFPVIVVLAQTQTTV